MGEMKVFLLIAFLLAAAQAHTAGEEDIEGAGTEGNEVSGENELTGFLVALEVSAKGLYDTLKEARRRLDAGEEVDMAQFQEQIASYDIGDEDIRPFYKAYHLALPIWKTLSRIAYAQSSDAGKVPSDRFEDFGREFLNIVQSDQAVPLLRAGADLIRDGLIYFLPPDFEEVLSDPRLPDISL